MRSAAEPPAPLLLSRLARSDDDATLRLFADARAGHVRIALEREVDRAALERLHRIQRDRVAGHLDLARGTHRDLTHGVLAALAVALDVDDHALAFGELLPDHHVGHRLQRAQRLTAPADQRAEVPAADVERDRLSARA